jgi:hypothetical protein
MKKRAVVWVVVLTAFLAIVSLARGADLQWDYPSDWGVITGYTVYFNEEGETDPAFNKTVPKNSPDITQDGTSVTYTDIDDKLNLAHNQPYNFYITAYNESGESLPSNIVTYTRTGYGPPADSLPDPVVSSPQSSEGLKIN